MATSISSNLCLSTGEDLKLWDCKSLKLVSTYKIPGVPSISRAVFSPRGDSLVTVGNSESSSSIYLVDVSKKGFTGAHATQLFQSDHKTSTEISRTEVAFSNGATLIAGGAENGQIDLCSCRTSTIKKTYASQGGQLSALLFSSDDSILISGDMDGDIGLRSVNGNSPMVAFKTNQQGIKVLRTVSFNDNLVCSAHFGGAVCLSDMQTAEVVHSFEAHLADCRDVAFSPVNPATAISVGLDNRIVIYDMRMKKTLNQLLADCSLTSATFLPSGAELLCGTLTGKIFVFDLRAGPTARTMIGAHSTPVTCLALQPYRSERLIGSDNLLGPATGFKGLPKKLSPGIERRQIASNGSGSEPSSSTTASSANLNRSVSLPKSKNAVRSTTTAVKAAPQASTGFRMSDPPKPTGHPPPVSKSKENGQGENFIVPAVPPSRVSVVKMNGKIIEEGLKEAEKMIKNDEFHAAGISSTTLLPVEPNEILSKILTKTVEEKIILETRISCLDVQDVVYAYGSSIQERVWNLEDEIKLLREDVQKNSAVLQAILTELRLIKHHMPY